MEASAARFGKLLKKCNLHTDEGVKAGPVNAEMKLIRGVQEW
jgi:hypothetical protein